MTEKNAGQVRRLAVYRWTNEAKQILPHLLDEATKKYLFLQTQTKSHVVCGLFIKIGVWCSWLACLHGVQVVARSSRATPTTKSLELVMVQGFFYCIEEIGLRADN